MPPLKRHCGTLVGRTVSFVVAIYRYFVDYVCLPIVTSVIPALCSNCACVANTTGPHPHGLCAACWRTVRPPVLTLALPHKVIGGRDG